MKLGKVKDVFMDFMKSGFRFGRGFSNMITERLEASATTARVGGGLFDLAAGGGITYLGVSSMIGNSLAIVGGVAALTTAFVPAVASIAVGTVFLTLGTMMTGIGLGFLDAAREKAGIPAFNSYRTAKRYAADDDVSTGSKLKAGVKKLFGASAVKKTVQPKKAAPSNDSSFKL